MSHSCCWHPSKPSPEFPGFAYAYAKRTPGPGPLEQFVALGDASDEVLLRYARHLGVLVICRHGLPASHGEDCRPMALPGRDRYAFWEPIESWRYFARHARRVLEVTAATYNEPVVDGGVSDGREANGAGKRSTVGPVGRSPTGSQRS